MNCVVGVETEWEPMKQFPNGLLRVDDGKKKKRPACLRSHPWRYWPSPNPQNLEFHADCKDFNFECCTYGVLTRNMEKKRALNKLKLAQLAKLSEPRVIMTRTKTKDREYYRQALTNIKSNRK